MISQALNGYDNPASHITSDLPYAQAPTQVVLPIKSDVMTKYALSTSADQGPGGSLLFSIPYQPNTALRTNSMYLRGELVLSSFSGMTGASNNLMFNNLTQDVGSCIQRYTIQHGGTVLEQQTNVGSVVGPAMLTHMMNQNAQELYGALSYAGKAFSINSGVDTTYRIPVVVPMSIGSITSEKNYPLYLNQSPLTIEVQLESSLQKIFYCGTDAARQGSVGSFTFTNAQVVYEAITHDQQYCNDIISVMKEKGSLYQLPCSSFQSFVYTSSSAIQQSIGSSFTSLNGVFFTFLSPNATQITRPAWKCYATTLAELQLDGVPKNSELLDATRNPNSLYAELRRAITGSLLDTECCSASSASGIVVGNASVLTTGSYLTDKFLLGINCTRCSDSGMSMKGCACSNIQLRINSSSSSDDQLIVLVHYDYIISFSADGSIVRTI